MSKTVKGEIAKTLKRQYSASRKRVQRDTLYDGMFWDRKNLLTIRHNTKAAIAAQC